MRAVRRLVAALLGLLGATGTALCVAGVVGTWVLHADLTARADRVFGRVEDRLGPTWDELGRAADRLRQVRREVEEVERREQEPAAPPAEKRRRPVLPKTTAESASAQFGQARQTIVTAIEVGLVADGVLDVLAELPAAERVGVDTARLRDASAQLSDLIRTADRLAAALPRAADDTDDPTAELGDRVGRVASTLDEAAAHVGGAHAQVVEWHRRTARGLTLAAVGVSVLLAWIGLGQVCLTARGFRR